MSQPSLLLLMSQHMQRLHFLHSILFSQTTSSMILLSMNRLRHHRGKIVWSVPQRMRRQKEFSLAQPHSLHLRVWMLQHLMRVQECSRNSTHLLNLFSRLHHLNWILFWPNIITYHLWSRFHMLRSMQILYIQVFCNTYLKHLLMKKWLWSFHYFFQYPNLFRTFQLLRTILNLLVHRMR